MTCDISMRPIPAHHDRASRTWLPRPGVGVLNNSLTFLLRGRALSVLLAIPCLIATARASDDPAAPATIAALSQTDEPGIAARLVRIPLDAIETLDPDLREWITDRVDACAIDRDDDGSHHAVLIIDPPDVQALRARGAEVDDTGSLADHITAFAPWNTLAVKRIPSIEAVVGRVAEVPSPGDPRGPGLNCQDIGTSLQPYGVYHSLDEGVCFMQNLAAQYPDIVRMISVGQSIEGRTIWALKISDNPDAVEPGEERILFTGVTHAREWATHEVMLYIAEYLTSRYSTDDIVRRIVDRSVVWLVPVVNVDGFAYSWNTAIPNARMWRKNRRINSGSSCMGVDINRNYSHKWGFDTSGSSTNPCSETFRGASAASEPETAAIQNLVAQQKFAVAVGFHSYSQLWLFPWGYTSNITSESYTAMRAMGAACSSRIFDTHGKNYSHGQCSYTIYRTNGDFTDFAYGAHGVLPFTPEVRPRLSSQGGFLLPENQILPCAEENLAAALWLMENVADAMNMTNGNSPMLFEAPDLTSRVGFSLPAAPVSQKPDTLLDYPIGFTNSLQTRLDDAAHNPAAWGAWPRDFEGCGSGSGYEVDIAGSTALRDWFATRSTYKALPYVYEGGADVMLSNVQSLGVNVIGIPSTVPVDLADVRVIKRVLLPATGDFGITENILEERTAIDDLNSPSPWIDWNWEYVNAQGVSEFAHPTGLASADTQVYPFRAYRVRPLVPSYLFSSTNPAGAVYLLRFPASSMDCNRNGILDNIDLIAATSLDCDGNGVPDECQPDCNQNGLNDRCDPEAVDIGLFAEQLIAEAQDPGYVCLFDLNSDSLLNGDDISHFVRKLLAP